MSAFWERKMKTYFKIWDLDDDGFISEEDFVDLARRFADLEHAGPKEKEQLMDSLSAVWKLYMRSGDMEKERRLTLPVFVESVRNQLYGSDLTSAFINFYGIMFTIMDVNSDGYLQPDEHKRLFEHYGVPDGRFDNNMAFEALDTNKDGKLSMDAFTKARMSAFWERKMRTYFSLWDFDHDGFISEEDFIDVGRRFSDNENGDPEVKQGQMNSLSRIWRAFMKAGDMEKEKRLTLPVLVQSVKEQMYGADLVSGLTELLKTMFKMLDTSNDGFLQPDEHKRIFEHYGVPEGLVDTKLVFEALDVNNDGKLSFDEYTNGLLEFFFSQDENNPNSTFFGPLVD